MLEVAAASPFLPLERHRVVMCQPVLFINCLAVLHGLGWFPPPFQVTHIALKPRYGCQKIVMNVRRWLCKGCFLVPGPHALAQETGKLMVVVVFQGYGRLCCPGRSLVTTNPSIDNKLSK